jgi:glycosyltransferase involved in cell wall biosynthesis
MTGAGTRSTLSVLIPVHAGADAEHFARALDSVVQQTRVPDEVLVVEDGPLVPAQTEVLEAFGRAHPELLRRLRLPVNRGSGAALAAGMLEARGDVVARMDADDIALPHRFATQLRLLEQSGCDVVGASMLEFEGDEGNVVAVRRLPGTHEQIARYARTRSPLNHPTVLLRRDAALDAGNYQEIGLVEDYDLWARMLANGARMSNVDEPLVLFRCSPAMFERRGGMRHLRAEWLLQRRLQDYGLIGPVRRWANLVVRIGFRLLPTRLLRTAYARVFRQSVPDRRGGAASSP